jgi:peptidoglycan/xylan/chitin deacetylase (PgdA/CDA1 family)
MAHRSGLLAALNTSRSRRGAPSTPILVYHRVVAPDDPWAERRCDLGMAVTEACFEAQMRHLARWYRVLPLEDLVACLRRGMTPPPRSLAITFDDGYEDNYRLAVPVLKRYGLHASFYLATGFIGTREAPWATRLERIAGMDELPTLLTTLKGLPVDEAEQRVAGWEQDEEDEGVRRMRRVITPSSSPEMLSWDQVREMHADGYRFGGHSRRHAILDREEAARARAEIAGSLADLQSHLETDAFGFAYPNGGQNAQIRHWVRDAGFQYACGMTEVLCGVGADLFDLPRRDVNMAKTTCPKGRFCPALFEATIHALFQRAPFGRMARQHSKHATSLPHP